jgi:uncharacterized membrane protein YraQ (UPF0718 family)
MLGNIVHVSLYKLYQENPRQGNILLLMLAIFLTIYFLPVNNPVFTNAWLEGLSLTNWYAREHVILCLLPAFLIAGAMATYISQGSVMRYLGPQVTKPLALGVASVSGALLAVCSCTVLPLFGGIYKRGAGLGAAIAFLYSGPAINIIAIVVTSKILGAELGAARAIGAIVFAFVIGFIMHVIYSKEESERGVNSQHGFSDEDQEKPLKARIVFFVLMMAILVFANWASADNQSWMLIYQWKWQITSLLAVSLAILLWLYWDWSLVHLVVLSAVIGISVWLLPGEPQLPFIIGIFGVMLLAALKPKDADWVTQTWDFTKQIMPLLLAGVFVAGLLLGRPGYQGLIPDDWVNMAVGGNTLLSTFLASLLGALMYFSTLTEVPIVASLLGAGMGKGPSLALLLAGPALSLPNMLVIRTIIGTQKTLVYCSLVVCMATLTGFIYGNFV